MENRLKEIEISFVFCDFSNEEHCQSFADLINHYKADPMGGGKAFTLREQLYLLDGMANHPASFVLFAIKGEKIIGLATCFINFSTFKAKPYLNIHDVIVKKMFRGLGIGRRLMERCLEIASERKYCKVTLEVRYDNSNAQKLYRSLGFDETEPVMHFWSKAL